MDLLDTSEKDTNTDETIPTTESAHRTIDCTRLFPCWSLVHPFQGISVARREKRQREAFQSLGRKTDLVSSRLMKLQGTKKYPTQAHRRISSPRPFPKMNRIHSTIPLMLVFLAQTLLVGHVSCLAASPSANNNERNKKNNHLPSSSSSQSPRCTIISTHTNGGRKQILTWSDTEGFIQQHSSFQGNDDDGTISTPPLRRLTRRIFFPSSTILSGIRSTFLPAGYPSKVPSGYLRYAAWGWIQ